MPGTSFSTGNWTGYDSQTVTNPGSALTDFTLLIDIADLSSTWKGNVQADGGDIRVTTGADSELPFDLINYANDEGSPPTVTGLIRVKWSGSLASSGSQTVKVWAGYTGGTATAYDDDDVSGYGADNAYNSDWDCFLPLASDLNDRTSNGNDGTAQGSISAGGQTGKFGSATNFDGSDDAVTWGSNNDDRFEYTDNFTISLWAKPDNYAQYDIALCDAQSQGRGYRIWSRDSSSPKWYWELNNDSESVQVASTTGINTSAWQMVTVSMATDDTCNIYINGSWENSSDLGADMAYEHAYPYRPMIGAMPDDSSGLTFHRFYDGLMQDVQIHGTQRSAAWIAEEYAQTNDNSGFWGEWSWTAQGAASAAPTGNLAGPLAGPFAGVL